MSSHMPDPDQGIFRYSIGDFKLTALHDGIFRRPLAGLLRNATVEQAQAALAESGLPTDALTVTFTPLLMEHAGELTLFDTGYGDIGTETNGFMLRNLRKAGFKPNDVTNVVISHFHPDHINGLRLGNGAEVFPDANILVPQKEWQFWMQAPSNGKTEDAIAANHRNVERVFLSMAGKVKIFTGSEEFLPGVTALDAPGHTPGHSVFRLSSAGRELLILSDITNHPALFVRNPDWSPSFDIIPDLAIETRKRFLNMAAESSTQVAFFHAPFPATGFIEKAQHGFRFTPVATA